MAVSKGHSSTQRGRACSPTHVLRPSPARRAPQSQPVLWLLWPARGLCDAGVCELTRGNDLTAWRGQAEAMAVQGPRAFRAHVAPENQCFLPVLTPARGWGWTSEGRNARCPLHMAVRRCVPAGGRHSHSELVTVRAINCSKNRLAHLFEYKKVRFRSQNRPPNGVTFHCEETAVPWLHRHTWHVGRFVVDVPPPLEGRRLCPSGPSVLFRVL